MFTHRGTLVHSTKIAAKTWQSIIRRLDVEPSVIARMFTFMCRYRIPSLMFTALPLSALPLVQDHFNVLHAVEYVVHNPHHDFEVLLSMYTPTLLLYTVQQPQFLALATGRLYLFASTIAQRALKDISHTVGSMETLTALLEYVIPNADMMQFDILLSLFTGTVRELHTLAVLLQQDRFVDLALQHLNPAMYKFATAVWLSHLYGSFNKTTF